LAHCGVYTIGNETGSKGLLQTNESLQHFHISTKMDLLFSFHYKRAA